MTSSRVRRRFASEWEARPSPSVAVCPIQKAEEIGARFGVPSSFVVESRTTGVPR